MNTIHPTTRTLRTVLQVLVALGLITPALVAFLAYVGVTVDGAWIGGLVAAATVLVTAVQNALERAGLITTIGAVEPESTPDPLPTPPGSPAEPTANDAGDSVGGPGTGSYTGSTDW